MKLFKDPVLFNPSKDGSCPEIQDRAKLNANGVWVGMYGGKTLEEMKVEHPLIEVGEYVDVLAIDEAMRKTEPVEISEDRYIEMRDVLPSEDWRRDQAGSSFKMSEYLSGRITSIYVAMGNRYFSFNDVFTLHHGEIMAKVKVALAKLDKEVTQ